MVIYYSLDGIIMVCIRLWMILFGLPTIWDMDVLYMKKKKKTMECITLEKIIVKPKNL